MIISVVFIFKGLSYFEYLISLCILFVWWKLYKNTCICRVSPTYHAAEVL